MPESAVTAEDIAEVTRQLGRPARDIVAIAARCVCGRPLVVKTKPRLENGTPFPTLYMAELQQLVQDDEVVSAQYLAAHQQYLSEREAIEVVEEITDFSAGGMPTRVKCLHALVGHSLAKGKGVNPIGDLALVALEWSPEVCKCV